VSERGTVDVNGATVGGFLLCEQVVWGQTWASHFGFLNISTAKRST